MTFIPRGVLSIAYFIYGSHFDFALFRAFIPWVLRHVYLPSSPPLHSSVLPYSSRPDSRPLHKVTQGIHTTRVTGIYCDSNPKIDIYHFNTFYTTLNYNQSYAIIIYILNFMNYSKTSETLTPHSPHLQGMHICVWNEITKYRFHFMGTISANYIQILV